ncbi:hypothetical protein INT43_003990 [Umbelopsis isabellina]|uniref:NAD(P)-binding protein n=1 Tax=Mortierella isabellina TaxID=91625 RepID=A0A8H7UC61_MORIS|nr:hypothetical protein INT43_003990 [Umbelopsis isabellina]
MSAAPVKIAIIGTGIFAYRHLKAFRAIGDKYQIVACCNRSREKAEKFAKEAGIPENAVYTDPKQVLQNPDVEAVDVLLPVQYNLEFVKAAIAAGKHIIFEKPIAHNIQDAQEICKVSQGAKSLVMVAENFAFMNVMNYVAQWVKEGGIGDVVNFTYSCVRPYSPNSPYYQTAWRQKPEHPGGYLSDGGVHNLAHIVGVLGDIQSVTSFASQTHDIHGAEDTLVSAVRMRSGAIGTINFTFYSNQEYQCAAKAGRVSFEIVGKSGTLRIHDEKKVEYVDAEGVVHPAEEFNAKIQSSPIFSEFEDVEGEFDHFYKAIRHGEKIVVPPTVAYQHFAFFVSALESAKTGKSVDLPTI